jgi:hypothetical protein
MMCLTQNLSIGKAIFLKLTLVQAIKKLPAPIQPEGSPQLSKFSLLHCIINQVSTLHRLMSSSCRVI